MGPIAAFELRQQVRSHVFLVVFLISTGLVAGASLLPQLQVAGEGGDSAAAVLRLHLIWSLFFLFTATAFAADAVLKDEATRFAALIHACGVGKVNHLMGRFAGAFTATALCFLSVPLGSLLAHLVPGRLPTGGWVAFAGAHARGLAFISLPDLFVGCALFFSLATLARSMMAAYLGAVAVIVLYGLNHAGASSVQGQVAALVEPFGFVALSRGAGAALAWNRALWASVGVAALIVTCAIFSFEQRGSRRPAQAPASREFAPPLRLTPAVPQFTAATSWAQAWARTRLEVGQVIGSPAFALLVLMAAASVSAALWTAPSLSTPVLLDRLVESVRLVPTVVVLFYAGELMWNEREHRVDALIASTPTSAAILLLPKAAALALVLLALAVATALAAVTMQLLRGGAGEVQLDRLLVWYVLPRSYDWILLAALAVTLQALSPNKVAGWGWMILFLIASLAMEVTGLHGGLYRYGGRLDGPLAATVGPHAIPHPDLLRTYWGAFACLLLVLACAAWGRGPHQTLRAKLTGLRRRLHGAALLIAVAALTIVLTCGLMLIVRSGLGY